MGFSLVKEHKHLSKHSTIVIIFITYTREQNIWKYVLFIYLVMLVMLKMKGRASCI